ncbi:hypothetical protein AAFC00_003531 [Neodothiora populina]|uniref:ATP-dependent RNA helicase n=1 Tax=Neodothiora populina TaxID=2781224 RepID=A0ABR3PEJ6_9PEZI
MDPLRLLTRSIKTNKKTQPGNGNGQLRPSAGPANNPQLFQDKSTANRKRKRGSDVQDASLRNAPALDFFGGSGGAGANSNGESKASAIDAPVAVEKDVAPVEQEKISQEGYKELLKSHKVKVTLLRHTSSDETPVVQKSKDKSKSKKSDKKSSSSSASSTKHREQLYPSPVTDFRRLRSTHHLPRTLAQNIEDQGYTTTTEVQLAALPLLLDPSTYTEATKTTSVSNTAVDVSSESIAIDLLTIAPTGSGKTLAFMIPLIKAIMQLRHHSKQDQSSSSTQPASRAIVLAPTKELASQIANEGRKLALNTGVRITNVRKGMRLSGSAGDSATDQEGAVPAVKADVLVSTPAALLNALGSASSAVESGWTDFRFLILDEADVLLDPLFREQTLSVWNALSSPALRVSFWSATMGSNIEELVKSTMDARAKRLKANGSTLSEAPLVRLVVGLKDSAVPNIDHQLIYAATEQGKLMALRQLLHPTPTNANDHPVLRAPFLIFTQTIDRAAALHSELQYDIPPEAGGISRIAVLHSDLSEVARDNIMTRFRKGEVWLLITTDLLSRGVDFRGINGVVNYDVPTSAAAYVHRVGRTGRAGREGGVALTYYTDDDVATIKTVANLIAASQKLRGSTGSSKDVQQWLLDALPTPSKRDRQQLKKRGIESRRSATGKDTKTGAGKTRISTKSGYIRKMENNRKGAVAASKNQQREEVGSGSEGEFGGFDD